MATIRTILTDALEELGVLAPGESLGAGDADFALRKLHRLLDRWNAERAAVYADVKTSPYTLTPSLQPHTIGPTGTWVTTQRPVEIVYANLILDSNIRRPITSRSGEWWMNLRTPTIPTTIPTDYWYNADWPNGSLYLWPVPTTAYTVELLIRIVLSNPAIDDTFTMPPGYQDAVTLTLSEDCASAYGRAPSALTRERAQTARAIVWANNDEPRRIATVDAGMPGAELRGGRFDWRDGRIK